jgi:hypothetical protein
VLRGSRPLLLLVVALLSFSLCFAQSVQQPQSPPPRDAQAIAILQKVLVAMGGIGAVQDTVTKANIAWPSNPSAPPIPSIITTLGPDRIRVDNSNGGQTGSVVYNRGRLLRSSAKGWTTEPSANSRFRRADHLPAHLLANELARTDYAVAYVGQESVGSQAAIHLKLSRISHMGNGLDAKFTKDSEFEVFIDSNTFLILKISYMYFSRIDWRIGSPMEIYYSDYRNVGGMMVPFTQSTHFNGNPLYELHLSSVAFNQGVPDTLFQVK